MLRNTGLSLKGKKVVLCASTGGHLQQLHRLAGQLDVDPDSLWITFDSEQSRSLLEGRRTYFIPYIASRDWKSTLAAVPKVASRLRHEEFDVALSTGAAVAGAVLPVARAFGKRAWYIESVARHDGPSITGKMLSALPGIKLYTQHPNWANSKWRYEVSVLQGYKSVPRAVAPDAGGKKAFVTLGTIRPYRFDSLVDRISEIVPADWDIVWQLGSTMREDLRGEVHEYMSVDEFDTHTQNADVVISHGGVGSALRILDTGKLPIMVPRRTARGEHVDDHQEQICGLLSEMGIARAVEADAINMTDLDYAQSQLVVGA